MPKQPKARPTLTIDRRFLTEGAEIRLAADGEEKKKITGYAAVFNAEDKAGGLFGVLELYARAGINLTRIESVPDKPGDYAIFIDFEGDEKDEGVAACISEATKLARGFRILGCYNETRL